MDGNYLTWITDKITVKLVVESIQKLGLAIPDLSVTVPFDSSTKIYLWRNVFSC